MRLDLYLYKNGFADSRTEAKGIITKGHAFVNGKPVLKPSYDVSEGNENITVANYEKKYASRAGYKLECAISNFDFVISKKQAIDVGASSGGFTDCLLQNGASKVIALDSGTDQLVKKLREDSRVYCIENYNARSLRLEDLPFQPDLAVMDVSFISATYIIPALFCVLLPGSDFICLIKPQFEVGKSNLGKGGIVKSESARKEALKKVVSFAEEVGFITKATTTSDIIGGDGNIEYLAHFYKPKNDSTTT